MPGKHHRSPFALLSRHRYPFVVGVVLVGIAVAGLLAAISNRRHPDPPLLIVPVVTALPSPVLIPPSIVAASPSPSPSVSPSRSRARPPSSRPARPPASARTASFTAQYTLVTGRRSSFRAAIVVTNTGSAARDWQVVVTHDPADRVRLMGGGDATVGASGNTITLSGNALGPGRSATVGYFGFAGDGADARPTSCKIEGRDCAVTTRRYRNE